MMFITAKENKIPLLFPIAVSLAAAAAALSLFSCASMINGTVSADSSAALQINMALQPRITALIRTLNSASGQTNGAILDGASIAQSMRSAPGIASVTLTNTSPSAVEGAVRISNINDFLASADRNKFVVFDRAAKKCQININRENGAEILNLLSPEITGYLNALMSPAATGESMSKVEYLELVSMFYSKAISDEIAASQIRAAIQFPGAITSVKSSVEGAAFSGRQANFNIPLLDLLVLETPLFCEVNWE